MRLPLLRGPTRGAMTVFVQIKTRVRNTFLEIVEDEEEVQPTIVRSKTDPAALRDLRCGGGNGTPADLRGFAAAAAAAASSAAQTAARAAVATTALPQCLACGALPLVAPGGAVLPEATGLPGPGSGRQPKEQQVGVTPSKGRIDESSDESSDTTDGSAGEVVLTTVMLRNLPNDVTRSMLLKLLDGKGFAGKYDFAYLPVDLSRGAGLGYAFVNMNTATDAQRVRATLEGYRRWPMPSRKVCSVGWSNPCQGLKANVERYRNSNIMHDSVPDEFKPVLLVDGRRVEFPRPTRRLQRPEVGKTGRPRP